MNSKRALLFPFLALAASSAAGCTFPGYVNVYWKNYDGSILKMERNVNEKKIPTYSGEDPTRPQSDSTVYAFSDWTKEVKKEGKVFTTTNVIFTANYTEAARKYHIEWHNYDDSKLYEAEVEYGTVPQYKGQEPKRESTLSTDYAFKGWDREATKVKSDMVYKATFAETNFPVVSIRYHFPETKNAIENPNVTSERSGRTVTLEDATCSGYKFDGWYTDAAYTKRKTSLPNISVNTDLWGKFDVETYNVTYDLKGGSLESDNPGTITCLQHVVLNKPTKVGYTFIDWENWETESHEVYTELDNICADLRLTAHFEPNTYLVTFKYAEQDDHYVYVKFDDPLKLDEVSKQGYDFEGWFYTDEYGDHQYVDDSKYQIPHDITLVQHWSDPLHYGLTFDPRGGSIAGTAPTYYTILSTPDLLPVPTRYGYDFVGWFEVENNNPITSFTGLFRPLNLYAQWSAHDVTINFNYNGGSLQRTVQFFNGTEQVGDDVKISPFQKVGFKLLDDTDNAQFNGWADPNDARESFASDRTINGDLKLHALWSNIDSGVEGTKIGDTKTFHVSGMNYQIYQYTPLVSQRVTFESEGTLDVNAELYRKGSGSVLASATDIDRDHGNLNFRLEYDLSANVTYLLKVISDDEGSGDVAIKSSSDAINSEPQGLINSEVYEISSMVQKYDEEFKGPGTPVKEGKVFAYWDDGNGNHYLSGTEFDAEVVNLTAVWADPPVSIASSIKHK